jgi:hypothetical protein
MIFFLYQKWQKIRGLPSFSSYRVDKMKRTRLQDSSIHFSRKIEGKLILRDSLTKQLAR